MTDPLELVLSLLPDYRRCGREYVAHCPAHDDSTPSLGVTTGDDGRVLLFCRSRNCRTEDVVRALGLTMGDLFPKNGARSDADVTRHKTARDAAAKRSRSAPSPGKTGGNVFEGMAVTDRYHYVDAGGELVFTVLRWEDPKGLRKKFFTQRPARKYKLRNKKEKKRPMEDVPRYLYRLPKVLRTVKTDFPVIVVEGEKDVKNLEALGFVATSGSGGACKWLPEYGESLRGGNIIIIPDNDDPGRNHAQMVLDSIADKAKRIRVLNLPGLKEKGDASDWLAAGGTKEQLIELAKACPDWELGTAIREEEEKPEDGPVEDAGPDADQEASEPGGDDDGPCQEHKQPAPPKAVSATQALETINAAIAVGTAEAVYADQVLIALCALEGGPRADAVQRITTIVKAATKRELKKLIGTKLKELHPPEVAREPVGDKTPVLLTPNKPVGDICEEAVNTIARRNNPERIFLRGGLVSRVKRIDTGKLQIEEFTRGIAEYELNSQIDFYSISLETGEVNHRKSPPEVLTYLISHSRPPFPPLLGLTDIPILRTDGTIVTRPGYDEATRMYYHPAPGFVLPPIPVDPTEEQVAQAAELLREVVFNMPFKSDADRTNLFALMLSPILRQLTGITPLALIDAPQASSGKSLLSSVVSLIITGKEGYNLTAPMEQAEWEKTLASVLLAGSPLVIFDNVKHYVESAAFEKVLTSVDNVSRDLGKTRSLDLVNTTTFVMTGNNLQIGKEITRRSYLIAMDPQMSRPEERAASAYLHPELKDWVKENRSRIVAALFTLIRHWFASGCPSYDVPCVGSYEKWVRVVGSVLTHAGFGGFLANRDKLRAQADQESVQWEAFLTRWVELYGEQNKPVSAIAEDILDQNRLGGVIPEDLSYCITGFQTNNMKIGRVFGRREGCRFGEQELRLVQGRIIQGQRMWTVLRKLDLPIAATGPANLGQGGAAGLDNAPRRDDPGPGRGVQSLDLAQMPDDDEEWKSYR